jgi:Bacterial nucleoid DNA-binding protein
MTKSELIEALAAMQSHLAFNDVELAVKNALEQMSQALAKGERIEIRGSAVFPCTTARRAWAAIPRPVRPSRLPGKHVPHFKPGKELRERVNASAQKHPVRG